MTRSARRAGRAVADVQDPQDWTSFETGDLVDVVEPSGYTFVASIEAKTQNSDVVWIRSHGMGTRHCLHHMDGTKLQAKAPDNEPDPRSPATETTAMPAQLFRPGQSQAIENIDNNQAFRRNT